MKKHIILFTVFAFALGVMLIAIGVCGCVGFVRMLQSDSGYESLIILMFYYAIMFLLLPVSIIFILLGIPYLIRGKNIAIAFRRNDLFKLQINLLKIKKFNTWVLILIITYDLLTIGSFLNNWQDAFSILYNIFIILLTVFIISAKITHNAALKRVQQELAKQTYYE